MSGQARQARSAFQLHEPLPMAERVRGLPRALPAGESMLWQGSPDFRALLRDAFHIRLWSLYVLAVLAWRAGSALYDGRTAMEAGFAALYGAMLGAFGLLIFALFAWLIARTTIYTITTKRVVISYGIALPKCVNIPFTMIEAVNMGLQPDGSGNLALRPAPKSKLSYLLLWPHVRPGRRGVTEPSLRCLADARGTAELLAGALTGSTVHLAAPAKAAAPRAAGEAAAA